mgnify:CR=1 FL=1
MTVPFMAFLIVTYRAQLLRPEPLLLRYTPAMEFFLSAWWRIGLFAALGMSVMVSAGEGRPDDRVMMDTPRKSGGQGRR